MSNIVTNIIIDIVIIDIVINRDEQETTVRKKKVVETSATSRMLASVATVATIATIVTATTIVAIVAAVETGTSVRRCTCRCLYRCSRRCAIRSQMRFAPSSLHALCLARLGDSFARGTTWFRR